MGGPQPETWGGLGGPLQKMSVDHEGALCSVPSKYSARNVPKIKELCPLSGYLGLFLPISGQISQTFHTPYHFCVFAGFYLPVEQDSSPEEQAKKDKNRDLKFASLGHKLQIMARIFIV